MTTGQRIALKRKEQNLSQEALGAQLGVSRQSIYKWESDASMPEIDKLIALSRLFCISVGELLGVEEPGADAPDGGELSEQQLKMAEEIAERYLAAQSARERSAHRRTMPVVFVCIILLSAAILTVGSKLGRLENRFVEMDRSVDSLQDHLNGQINDITGRVEEILRQQNTLTADSGAEISLVNPAENRIVFDVFAVPKTYSEGMGVLFRADDGSGGITTVHSAARNGEKFSAALACGLTDSISLSIILTGADGTCQTQLLKTYRGLYSDSLPTVSLADPGTLLGQTVSGGTLTVPETELSATPDKSTAAAEAFSGKLGNVDIRSIQVGLFRDQTLVVWAEPCSRPETLRKLPEGEGTQFFRLPETSLTLRAGQELRLVAWVTDGCGRRFLCPGGSPYVLDGDGSLVWAEDSSADFDPSHWSLEPCPPPSGQSRNG